MYGMGYRYPHTIASLPIGYHEFLDDIKARIRSARIKAALSANRELLVLYWGIGRSIVERQRQYRWGRAVVDRLAADLQKSFSGTAGFSPRNIWRMRAFYLAWPGKILAQAVQESRTAILKQPASESKSSILTQPASELGRGLLPQAVAEIPWFHNVILIQKLKDPAVRLWYAQQTLEHGWSRDMLAHQIESGLCLRQGKAVTNFRGTLPPPQSDLAEQAVKDPYVFDFLAMSEVMRERELEAGLLDQIQRFLIELGVGFAFVGRQVRLEVGGEDYFIDLLFYHLRLRCYIAVELKAGKFKPEYAGKMNFHLSAVDERLRHPDDKPSIGLILCRAKHRLTAEYALRGISAPIGVADWKAPALPDPLRRSLPTIAQLEAELRPLKAGQRRSRASPEKSS